MMKPHIERVVAVPYDGLDADTLHRGKGYYSVHGIWTGVVFANPEIKQDVNGKTYVAAKLLVQARTINADLTRLRF